MPTDSIQVVQTVLERAKQIAKKFIGDTVSLEGLDKSSEVHEAMVANAKPLRDLMRGPAWMRKTGNKEYLPRKGVEDDATWKSRAEASHFEAHYQQGVDGIANRPFQEDIRINEDVPGYGMTSPEDLNDVPEPIPVTTVRGRVIDFHELVANVENTPTGRNLTTYARDQFREGLQTGIAHTFVDHPVISARTQAEEQASNVRPFFVQVLMEDLFKWSWAMIEGIPELWKIYLKEPSEEPHPTEPHMNIRVNRIKVVYRGDPRAPEDSDAAFARYELFRKTDTKGDTYVQEVPGVDEDGNEVTGVMRPMRHIPLAKPFQADTNAGPMVVQQPPLNALGHLEIAYYQSMSMQQHALDFERFSMLFGRMLNTPDGEPIKVGATQLVEGNTEKSDLKRVEGTGVGVKNGEVSLQQMRAQMTVLKRAPMVLKESGPEPTARGERGREAQATSDVKAWINTGITGHLNSCLALAAEWMGLDPEQGGTVQPSENFGLPPLEGADIVAVQKARQLREITQRTHLKALRRRMLPDLDVEEEIRATREEALAFGAEGDLDDDEEE